MFYIGIIFIVMGLYLILEEIYDFKLLLLERKIIKKEDFIPNNFYEFKLLLGIFIIIVGFFSILNHIYF